MVFLLACTTKIYTNFQIIAQSALHGPQRPFFLPDFIRVYVPIQLDARRSYFHFGNSTPRHSQLFDLLILKIQVDFVTLLGLKASL